MRVEGKAAIVTGGGTGVGRSTALKLAERGCNVLINYSRSRDEAEATAAEVRALGVQGVAIEANVVDDAACRSMVSTALAAFGRLDILVNNAATTAFIPLDDFEAVGLDDWNRIFDTNVRGVFQCIRAAREALEKAGDAEIVNVSSIAGLLGVGSSIPYCASKAALNNLTLAMARLLAPRVRVNAVAPGLITSRWLKDGLGDEAYDAYLARTIERAPLHRVCAPDDVADLIVNIITGPDLITGQIMPIEGGVLTGRL
ncbi:MAG: SDR family NAD(P)-dependent oxidoreductase [Acidobacteriota bacterium]